MEDVLRSRPTNRSHFEKLISEVSKQKDIEPARLRRWISQMMIVGAIDQTAGEAAPGVVLKGGVTMELRFSVSARATRDLDAIVSGSREEVEEMLDRAFSQPYEGFSFQMTPPQEIANTDAHECEVKLSYGNRPWATEKLEFSLSTEAIETEQLPPIDLSPFGVDVPATITCLSLRYQIAQKLHAVSAVWEGRENPRFRDIVDLLLLAPLVDDHMVVREACIEVFELRATNDWPPTLTAHESWHEPYRVLATNLDVEPNDLDIALDEVSALINQIDSAS